MGGGGGGGGGAKGRHRNDFFPHHIYCAQSKVKWAHGVNGSWGGRAWTPIVTPLLLLKRVMIDALRLSVIITYEGNKGHIYRTISHVCNNKIVCPLGNFVACDWLS